LNHVTELLGKIPLFKDLTPEGLAHLSKYLKASRVSRGTVLLEAGETAGRLVLLVHGRASITRRTRQGLLYETAGPGSVVGVLDVLSQGLATLTLRTEEESITLSLGREDLDSFLREHPHEACRLLQALAGYLNQTGSVLDVTVPPVSSGTDKAPRQRTDAPDISEREGVTPRGDSPFYTKQHLCPVCGAGFSSLAVKSKHIRLAKTDSDFCPHYETVNPLFYEVLVCPHCGYAFTEDMPRLTDREKAALASRLPEIRSSLSFGGERDLDLAIESFRLAIRCLEIVGAKKLILGKFYLKMAWLYRLAAKETEERANLGQALTYLEQAYQTEQSADPVVELNLIYLLGDLNLRLGNEKAAVRWFSQILEHPRRSANPAVLNRTRERWFEIRQRHKEKG